MIEIIQKKLEQIKDTGLPGIKAHKVMAPKLGEEFFRNMIPPATVRKSSVLIPILSSQNDVEILFTQRSTKLKHHGGQISFPGGRIEDGETPMEAALRETYEEIGIPKDGVEVYGKISDLYVEPSNNIIYPFIAELKTNQLYNPSYDEVEKIIIVPLNYFIDPNNRKKQKRIISGTEVEMPFWDIGSEAPLWGATAMILQEFIEIVTS